MILIPNTIGSSLFTETIPESIPMSPAKRFIMVMPHNRPKRRPKKTARPPTTGTGTFCNLRASGLSTRFFSLAIFNILKYTQRTASSDTTTGKPIMAKTLKSISNFCVRKTTSSCKFKTFFHCVQILILQFT